MSLPFKISAQPAGVRKAWGRFQKQYGSDAERIFLAKAEEQGHGKTIRQRVLSVYNKGVTLK